MYNEKCTIWMKGEVFGIKSTLVFCRKSKFQIDVLLNAIYM